ncbi:Transmembrane channel-like protein 6, partial [Anas platyrhynchos]
GYFTHSLLYYGYYSNITLNDPSASSLSGSVAPSAPPRLPYNMPLAYLFTVGVSFFATCILLVYSMYRSFGESYRVGSSAGDLAIKVFCAWDFKVVQRRSVKLQCENICTQLKELLAERRSRSCPLSLCQRLGRVAVLLLAWVLSLGTVLGCVVAVHYLLEHMHAVRDVPPRLPLAQGACSKAKAAVPAPSGVWQHGACWAALLVGRGQSAGQGHPKAGACGRGRGHGVPALLYESQTAAGTAVLLLSWLQAPLAPMGLSPISLSSRLGVLFAPLLPAVQVLKLLLLFYIKKTSLMQNCQAPSKPWQASRMSTVFITLLCFPSFLGAAVFISYIIWSVKPSETCGPFQGLETIYKSVNVWAKLMEKSSPNITWLTWIQQYLVENTFFLFFVSGVLLAMTYCHIQVVKGQRRIICLLKEQIANEGEDKIFLIEKLHCIYQQKE